MGPTVPSMPQSSQLQSPAPLLPSTMELTDQLMDMDTDRSAINLLANHTRENTEAQHRASLLSPTEFMPSMPQSLPMLPQLLLTVPSMLPQLLLMLPQLTMPQLLLMLPLLTMPQ